MTWLHTGSVVGDLVGQQGWSGLGGKAEGPGDFQPLPLLEPPECVLV